ncbi:Venom carboxylesterase-6 [Dufourea novaeangliae]|uniref:Venom carboxylesterase-6 n=1 Tax=Dufourea novaeangliae TaxID=178035 RepID=A0A154NXK2_DUFNO|nr:Venom carboxylesterase-6 [Dufourea novaeangliae]
MKRLLWLLFLGFCVASTIADCTVETHLGLIQGTEIQSDSGKVIRAYKGIPYAEPPVGKLRFQPPVPKKPWDDVLNANKDHCQCPQFDQGRVKGSEDCLFLNVYTPEDKPASLLPVFVFIHGGNFVSGNASTHSVGPKYLLDKPIVVVTINYRLNILGFSNSGDNEAPGNCGLKDQQLALQWVKVFAEITRSWIGESGNVLCPQAFNDDPSYYELPKKVAKICNCTTSNNREMVECLQNVNVSTLLEASLLIFDDIDIAAETTWAPSKEKVAPDAFITDTPENLLRKHKMKYSPVILGNVQDEGTFFTKKLLDDQKLYDQCVKEPVSVIAKLLRSYSPARGKNRTKLAVELKNFYLGAELPTDKETVIRKYTELASDLFYWNPLQQLLRYLRNINGESLYAYNFCYHGTLTGTLPFGGELSKTGVAHGDDLFYELSISGAFLGSQYANLKRSENDLKIRDIYIDLWISFVSSGKPTSRRLDGPNAWQPQGNNTERNLQIGDGTSTTVTMKEKYPGRFKFWDKNMPKYCL